jgi:hypothetical protein
MSRAIATSILRKFSAWRSSFEVKLIFDSLVTPSTRNATSSPNSLLDVVDRREGVLDTRRASSAGAHARGVEAQIGDDARDVRGVHEVRLAALRGRFCPSWASGRGVLSFATAPPHGPHVEKPGRGVGHFAPQADAAS